MFNSEWARTMPKIIAAAAQTGMLDLGALMQLGTHTTVGMGTTHAGQESH